MEVQNILKYLKHSNLYIDHIVTTYVPSSTELSMFHAKGWKDG